jgi:HPt (histidine-containing phosphotransfer) domain-containing protein
MAKLYNLDYLNEISEGDKDFILDMLTEFVTNTPETITEIETQVVALQWGELYKTVHKFVSTFDFIGAKDAIIELRKLENFAKTSSNVDQIPNLVEKIKSLSTKVIFEIKTDFKI